MILLLISFVAGILTILAPCTLPLLPVIVGSSVTTVDGKKPGMRKAFVIAGSLGASIILFTLFLKVSTLFIQVPASTWSIVSGVIILIFGIVTLFPKVWEKIPFIAKLNRKSNTVLATGYKKQSFWGDVIIGASLGPVFSTCSPTYFIILATVLPQSLALGVTYLFAYAIGLVGILLVVAYFGQKFANKLGGISDSSGKFKKVLGIIFIIIGILVLTGVDKKLEKKLLESGFGDVSKLEQKLLRLNDKTEDTGEVKPAPELVKPSGFVNTDGKAITLAELKGDKVILLDVWTYSCINCQRTIPYLNAWYDKYKEYGFEIVGVHTPEFAFERLQENVEQEVEKFGIKYPVVLDNDYATWNAYGNQYWPRKYLINVDGNIVYDHIGEGDYAETEREIQKALVELNQRKGNTVVIPTDIVNPNVATPERSKVKSPEVYFGAGRNQLLANGTSQKTGVQDFVVPDMQSLRTNALYLGGKWNVGFESATSESAGKITFKYDAKNVYMVARSENAGGIPVTIKRDGVVIKTITVQADSLYTLIEGSDYGTHILEIEVPAAGFEIFTFTFG